MKERDEFIEAILSLSPAIYDWYIEQVEFNRSVLRHCRAMEKALYKCDKSIFDVYRKERLRLFHLDNKKK